MIDLDLELAQKFPKLKNKKDLPVGILGTLQAIGLKARRMVEASEKRSAELDKMGLVDSALLPTDNGASGENIGSHSLMSKDGEHKLPLPKEAVQLATRVGVYIAQRMMEKIDNSLSAGRSDINLKVSADAGSKNSYDITRLDWLHLLRHFIAHPEESEKCASGKPWWEEALATDTSNTAHDPAAISIGEVNRRIQEEPSERTNLEWSYNSLD